MKKLNLNNQVSEDDENLVDLLKTSTGQEPSPEFVEKTLKKFLVLQSKQRAVHKPLKSPLYMMLGIALVLLILVLPAFNTQLSLPDIAFDWEKIFENISGQVDVWYVLTPMLLVAVLTSFAWFELGIVQFRNPFN